MLQSIPTKEDIVRGHQLIKPFIHRTPILTSSHLDALYGASLFFKCENFQKIGAFKFRGGIHSALLLSKELLQKGLATHSSGNHAQAISKVAQLLGVKAYIVMPKSSPQVKVDAVNGYGAEIFFCDDNLESRESTLKEICFKTGAHFIHPYNDYNVICGQATCAKELIEDIPDLDYIFAPVGGGGLLSGTLLSAKYFSKAKVIAGEPETVNDAFLSLKAKKIMPATGKQTIADGLKTALGDKTFPIIAKYVEDILLVSEDEIKSALEIIYTRLKIVVEPSCAVPLAAFRKHKEIFRDKRIGIILTGGNVDLKNLF